MQTLLGQITIFIGRAYNIFVPFNGTHYLVHGTHYLVPTGLLFEPKRRTNIVHLTKKACIGPSTLRSPIKFPAVGHCSATAAWLLVTVPPHGHYQVPMGVQIDVIVRRRALHRIDLYQLPASTDRLKSPTAF